MASTKQPETGENRSQEITPTASKWASRPLEEMERLYESVFPRGWLRPSEWEWPSLEKMRPAFARKMPVVDVIDHENEIILRAEVPGVRKDDLNLSISNTSVTLHGHTESESTEEKRDYYCHEISRGEFTRTVPLPAAVDVEATRASLTDGVLQVIMPKVESAKRRPVHIDIG